MAQIPPWLTPPNFLGAAQAGAQLGAQLRGQDIQQREVAERMRLSFAEQAFKQQMFQQQQAEDQQKLQQQAIQAMMQQNRFAEESMLNRERMALDREQGAAEMAQRKAALSASVANQAIDNRRLDLGQAETNRHNLALEGQAAQPKPPPPLSPASESNIINRLQNQWTGATKTATELDRAINLMDAGLTAAKRGDMAAGSQAVLVTFQKILDPTSVVRESEYARSGAGQSLLNRIQGGVERLAKGGAGVPIDQLEKFAQLAKEAASVQKVGLATVRKRIGSTADRYNIPNELVLDDRGAGGTSGAAPQQIDADQNFKDESSARSAGFKNGDVIKLYDPGTRSYRNARLK